VCGRVISATSLGNIGTSPDQSLKLERAGFGDQQVEAATVAVLARWCFHHYSPDVFCAIPDEFVFVNERLSALTISALHKDPRTAIQRDVTAAALVVAERHRRCVNAVQIEPHQFTGSWIASPPVSKACQHVCELGAVPVLLKCTVDSAMLAVRMSIRRHRHVRPTFVKVPL